MKTTTVHTHAWLLEIGFQNLAVAKERMLATPQHRGPTEIPGGSPVANLNVGTTPVQLQALAEESAYLQHCTQFTLNKKEHHRWWLQVQHDTSVPGTLH